MSSSKIALILAFALSAGACASIPADAPSRAGGSATSNSAASRSVTAAVGDASVQVPAELGLQPAPTQAVADVARASYVSGAARLEFSYGISGNVSSMDGNLVQLAEGRFNGFAGRYGTFDYGAASGGFRYGTRVVVFRDDFTTNPRARRLLVELYCNERSTCDQALGIARSVTFR